MKKCLHLQQPRTRRKPYAADKKRGAVVVPARRITRSPLLAHRYDNGYGDSYTFTDIAPSMFAASAAGKGGR